jgi:hypothetical protein
VALAELGQWLAAAPGDQALQGLVAAHGQARATAGSRPSRAKAHGEARAATVRPVRAVVGAAAAVGGAAAVAAAMVEAAAAAADRRDAILG